MGSGNAKEVIMGTTLRNLSGTFKEAKAVIATGKIEELSALNDDYEDDFNADSARHENLGSEIKQNPLEAAAANFVVEEPTSEVKIGHEEAEEEDDEDVIDIDNPDDLAAKGLKRIQIEGEEEEYLMDLEGNIYDLRGNFIGTTDDDGAAEATNPLSAPVDADNVNEVNEDDVEYGDY